ncbi:MAG TPA: hypothetical protein VFQ23_19215, partial [Anaerolineales bacterium]|nr:hypothetical protein [Anaerolineales bacterium]
AAKSQLNLSAQAYHQSADPSLSQAQSNSLGGPFPARSLLSGELPSKNYFPRKTLHTQFWFLIQSYIKASYRRQRYAVHKPAQPVGAGVSLNPEAGVYNCRSEGV